ncbi:MAG: hypothetical protein AAGJ32_08260 [Pseudomonadota bacterium]
MKTASRLALTAGVVALAAAGAASAQSANGTPAGEVVQNGFTLNYTVGGSTQPTITNDNDGERTTFVVDRLVDLTLSLNTSVDGSGRKSVAEGASGETLVYTITNDGNDIQSYSFSFENSASESADDFDSVGGDYTITYTVLGVGGTVRSGPVDLDGSDPGNPMASCEGTSVTGTIEQFVTAGGSVTDSTIDTEGSNVNSADITCPILPDERIVLTLTRNIPTGAGIDVTDTDDFIVVAETREPYSWINEDAQIPTGPATSTSAGGEVDASLGGVMAVNATNTDDGVQNVFLDEGANVATSDSDSDGLQSLQNGFAIVNPALTGTKTAIILATELAASGSGSTCDDAGATGFDPSSLTADPNGFALPGACIAYVIEVDNVSSPARDATGISVSDTLPAEVEYKDHVFVDFDTAPTDTSTTCSTASPATNTPCDVIGTAGALNSGNTGQLVIYTTLR